MPWTTLLGDLFQGTPFYKGYGTPSWGMHFYASRDYMHLGTIFPRIPSGDRLCLLSPSSILLLSGGYASGLPFSGLRVKALLFRGDMVPPQWGMHFMHLGTICISRLYLCDSLSGGYGSLFRGPLFLKGDMSYDTPLDMVPPQ